jgi:hypothetical protein
MLEEKIVECAEHPPIDIVLYECLRELRVLQCYETAHNNKAGTKPTSDSP